MKKGLSFTYIFLLGALLCYNEDAQARRDAGQHRVKPHVRKNGQYVLPHARTNPRDSVIRDNWSTKGNVNPHTGKPGKVNPYKDFSRGY